MLSRVSSLKINHSTSEYILRLLSVILRRSEHLLDSTTWNEGDVRRSSTYPELDHERVHDAADHCDEVEQVPGVLEEILLAEGLEKKSIRNDRAIDLAYRCFQASSNRSNHTHTKKKQKKRKNCRRSSFSSALHFLSLANRRLSTSSRKLGNLVRDCVNGFAKLALRKLRKLDSKEEKKERKKLGPALAEIRPFLLSLFLAVFL